MTKDSLRLTLHAEKRLQQRGIPIESVKVIIGHGDRRTYAGDGCVTIGMTRARTRALLEGGYLSPQASESITRFAVVVTEGGAIITVYVRNRRANRARFKRSKSFYHRNSQRTPRRLGRRL